MARYYTDENGNLRKSNTETNKKKKNGKRYTTDENGNLIVLPEENAESSNKKADEEDIAPVKKTTESKTTNKKIDTVGKVNERTWFQAGAFEDGYQLGDITKTAFGTINDVASGIAEGVVRTGEGILDAGAYGVAWGADLVGADSFADDVRKVAQKDETGALFEQVRGNLPNIENSLLGEKSRGVTNALGQIATAIATGGAGAAVGLGKLGVTALTAAFQGVSSAGLGTSEAYQGGATDEEAALYGITKGAIDATSELIFGGLGKVVKATGLSHGLSSLDDVAAKKLSDTITRKITSETIKRVVGNSAELAVKSSAEGLEEVIAGVGTAVAKKFTYMEEEELLTLLNDENLLEQFIVGAVTSGIAQTPDYVSSIKSDTDFITDRTTNEQTVIDKEVEKRISLEEAENGKLSNKQKQKIEEQVERDMERGYISTDTIEEVLGGDTYTAYKSTLDRTVYSTEMLEQEKEEVKKHIEELTQEGDTTGVRGEWLKNLNTHLSDINAKIEEAKIEDAQKKASIEQLKSKLSEEVSAKVAGDRLYESYNERARRKEAFQVDLDGYNEAQRKVVESAINSGILNNTNRTHEFVDLIAKIAADKGVLFDFTNNKKLRESGFAIGEGVTVNGFTSKNGVTLNMDSAKTWQATVGHEITHVLEGTEAYTELQKALFEYAKAKGEYDSRLASVTALYQKYDPTADPSKELTADLVGDYLFNDVDFINNLSVNHRNVFQKIYDEIKYLAKVVTAGSKEARQIEKMKRAFEKAYRAQKNTAADSGVKYSFGVTQKDIDSYVDAAYENRNDTDYKKYAEVSERLLNDVSDEIDLSGYAHALRDNDIRHIRNSHGENTSEKYPITKEDIKNIPWIVENYDKTVVVKRKDGKTGVFYIKATEDGLVYYLEQVTSIYGNEPLLINKQMIKTGADDIPGLPGLKEAITKKQSVTEFLDDLQKAPKVYAQSVNQSHSDTIIPENSEKSSTVSKNLTPEQEEYFKDSVVRDENGNLKVMYHGTSAGGHTVFDPYGKARYGLFGAGSYFTDNKEIAESYTKKGKGTNPQVYETYLNIKNPIDMDAQADPAAWAAAMPDVYFPGSGTNEDFYRAMEEYFEDAEYPRWEAAETAMGVIEEMGYDGITHIGGGRVNADGVRHRVYIAFQPEQIKNVDNVNPTSDPDIRFSLSEDGTVLTDAQANFFKDSKIRTEDGSLQVMYHGSQESFDAFDRKKAKSSGTYGSGFYFSNSESHAGTYGNTYKVYLNIKNPLQNGDSKITKEQLRNFVQAIADNEDYGIENYGYGATVDSVTDSIYGKSDFAMILDLNITSVGNMVEAVELFNEVNGTDYDGIVAPTETVAFYPEQVKRVDNLNPTEDANMRNSLSSEGAPSSRRGTPLRDLRLEEDIAPVAENPQAKAADTKIGNVNEADYAPYTESEANTLRDENFARLSDADAPPETETPYYNDETEAPLPDDPFKDRDMKEVGNRKVKAYMYENPEVKPFFQEEANIMLGELERTTKGERVVDAQVMYDTNGEAGIYGTTRHTSDDIVYLRDELNISYADIRKGLENIIKDDGLENNAVSKRIEFLLNDRLLNGYRDMDYGFEYPPNDGYLKLLNEKQITEYNEESRARFFENMDAYVPPVEEDIAPVREDAAPKASVKEAPKPAGEFKQTEGKQLALDGMEEAEAEPVLTRKSLHESIVNNIKERFADSGFDLDKVLKKAKNLSTFATVDNTPQRVMEKALGYKEGNVLADLTVNKVAQNETEGIKWLNSFTDRKSGLLAELSKQYNIKPGSKKSAAAQMYAEGFYVDGEGNIVAYGDAELAKDFPNAQVQRDIKGLASDPRIRQVYDETLAAINASRTRNAYPEIPRLDNYFLHFRAMEDTFSRLGLPFNPNDIRAKDLPTDLNGVTADLKPGQPYFASAMHRTGQRTSFDLLGGLEKYLGAAKNQIYHIDDIQTLRALRNYIADTYGQAHGLENLDNLSDAEAEERIREVYGSHLSTFAKFLNEEANVLAGKTSLIDRGIEGIIGRRGITFLDSLNRQVGANMVGFNVSSSMTNFLSVVQAMAKSNKFDFVKAFTQTAANRVGTIFGHGDGFAESSPVMIRRKGVESFYRTPWQKASDAGYVLMSAVDEISTELIARAKYNEYTRKGLDAQRAHIETDKWVSRLMGDRSLGQQPQLYNSKMLGIITKFQLEVRNQLDSQFYDTIQEEKVSTEEIQNGLLRNAAKAAKITGTFVQLALLQHIFGKAFESVAGYNPSFDIIDTIIKLFGLDDEEEDEDTALDNISEGFLALLGDLPYASTLTGGRIPLESALPIQQFVTGKDKYGNEKSRLETLSEAAPYYVLPGGYGQIKKTVQGLDMFSEEHPIAGSYTDSGNLRFPVDDTTENRVQAALFGQWASGNARDYFDNERSPLKEKQIEEFMASGMSIQDYWDYREGLSEHDKIADKADYINSLDLPISTKNLLINNIADRKEPIDMTDYDLYDDFEEFDYAAKNPEMYRFLQDNNVNYSDYKSFDEDAKEAWSWAYNNPESFTVSKAVTDDVVTYRRYASELNKIKADKDDEGKTISGSRKEKVIDYINSLDADYGEKIILFKNEYNADDTYNSDILDYLNSRDDISYEDTVTILKKLGFTVTADGNVSW